MTQGVWQGIVYALAPTILLGIVFWVVMRAILRSDRTERKVYAEIEAEERARLEREHPTN
jgi:flagellar biosynthesis/type III secretory pathway M-ring protein FliF/YscJ